METGWKIAIIILAILAIGMGLFNYFTFGKVLLSPEGAGGQQFSFLLTWSAIASIFILIFVILFIIYKLREIKHIY